MSMYVCSKIEENKLKLMVVFRIIIIIRPRFFETIKHIKAILVFWTRFI